MLFSLIGSSILIPNSSAQEETKIPNWIKNVAEWWANNEISEEEFLAGITYLINNNIISLTFIPCSNSGAGADPESWNFLSTKLIPDWVKNNAGWWATGQIEDADFINGIEYLIKKTILGIDNEKIKGKVPIEDVKFSSSWAVDKDKMVFVSSSFFEVYGVNDDCMVIDGISKWKSTTLGLNPNKMDRYNEIALWNDPVNAVVVYPYFTHAAYQSGGFYDYYRGNCDYCTTTKFAQPISQYASSGKAHQALTLLGYSSITDVEIDKNPSILQQFDKVIILHNEYVTRPMFDAITSHPNVIYLYPNALYAEIEVNYTDETITLIRGHDYPEPSIANGFDWQFDNTHPYEYDDTCLEMEFYSIPGPAPTDVHWMTNCYPENLFLANTEQIFNVLKAIKDL